MPQRERGRKNSSNGCHFAVGVLVVFVFVQIAC